MSFGRFTEEVLASAARTATVTVELDVPPGAQGVWFLVDVTVDATIGILTFNMDGFDSVAAEQWTILDSANVDTVSFNAYLIHPGAETVANSAKQSPLPSRLKFHVEVADAASMTYSVQAVWLP